MQVDRALVDGGVRARGRRRCRAARPSRVSTIANGVAARAAQRHRAPPGTPRAGAGRTCRPGARAARPPRPALGERAASAGPRNVRVGRLQRALVRGAQQVRGVDLLVLVVEDRRLDRPVEELVGVAAEELVERVLARDVDRQPAAAPPRAAPHLAQRGDGARERHADRRVERADVDAELERVGGDDAEQLAVDQPRLELAPLLRRVARAVGRDPLGQVGAARGPRARAA